MSDRWLIWHPESDCLFEAKDRRMLKQCLEDGCEDVTGFAEYEKLYAKKGKQTMSRRAVTRPVMPEKAKKEEEVVMPDQPLHVKYRPRTLDEVLGQNAVVKSLAPLLKKSTAPHAYLFTGPSGCGKTTLARILADHFKCEPANIIEVDAASNTGIDAMREVTSTLRYKGFGNQPNKMIIIDECHALSKAAWQSLLKSVEEPPEHVYFAFCTTDSGKIPDTIRTRCASYDLKPVRYDDIMDLLEMVADQEKLDIPDSFLEQVGRACNGSPRQALVMLPMVVGCEDPEEVARILEQPLESKEVIDLARLLVSGSLTWSKVQSTLKAMEEPNPESIRIIIVNYLNACLIGAKSERDVPRLLDVLSSFSKPCNPTDKMAPILLALGDHIFPA